MLIGHKKQWDFLKRKFEQEQLSHAYLFAGTEGIGKKFFAKEFVKYVNCPDRKNAPCQKCFPCRSIDRESFPDFKIISRKAGKSQVEISQIREAQNFLSYKSYYGSFKSIVVDNAENMSQEAQSCFLKTLEEPKGSTILFLISSKPDMLLKTIFSRCQTVKFFKPDDLPPDTEKLERERKLLKGLVSVIGQSFADKFRYVKSIDFENQSASETVEVLQKYLRHLLMVRVGAEKAFGPDESFKKYSADALARVITLSEDIAGKLLLTNANPKLAMEILLMEI